MALLFEADSSRQTLQPPRMRFEKELTDASFAPVPSNTQMNRFILSVNSLKHWAAPLLILSGFLLINCSSDKPAASSIEATRPLPCQATCHAPDGGAGIYACADTVGESICRRICSKHDDCAFNEHCKAGSPQSYCVADKKAYRIREGQWGALCRPSGKIAGNPDCDSDQKFGCYAIGSGDANAYCTQFDCTDDGDCAGGFYCARANVAPNAETDSRSFGPTRKVCLRRFDYCAPCSGDFDCVSPSGIAQKCVKNAQGSPFCAPQCQDDGACPKDAACTAIEGGLKACTPRAKTCVGDGSLCSPCRADSDCPKGACAENRFSHERFCTVKLTAPCDATTVAECAKLNKTKARASCTKRDSAAFEKDSCIALVQFGTDPDGNAMETPGCWSPPQP